MVKNSKGGKNAKKMGRKFACGSAMADRRVRYSECDEEKYACVTKYHGGGQVDVMCIDGQTRLGIIRKNCGRSKRDNFIGIGTYVLVGLRDWEVVAKGKKGSAICLRFIALKILNKLNDTFFLKNGKLFVIKVMNPRMITLKKI